LSDLRRPIPRAHKKAVPRGALNGQLRGMSEGKNLLFVLKPGVASVFELLQR